MKPDLEQERIPKQIVGLVSNIITNEAIMHSCWVLYSAVVDVEVRGDEDKNFN